MGTAQPLLVWVGEFFSIFSGFFTVCLTVSCAEKNVIYELCFKQFQMSYYLVDLNIKNLNLKLVYRIINVVGNRIH